MRWAFLGAKEQGLRVAQALCAAFPAPALIVTVAETPAGEQAEFRALAERAGAAFALDTQLAAHAPQLAALDVALVCRFPLLPEALFSLPRLGCVNVHHSLLPAYRGVHPVAWALVRGEEYTGVTLHRIDAGVDTGPILLQERLRIEDTHDMRSLTDALNALAVQMCLQLFATLAATGALPPARAGHGPSSYARRRTEADSRIDWHAPARAVWNLTRAMQPPLPPAFCFAPGGGKVALLRCVPLAHAPAGPGTVLEKAGGEYVIACGQGAVRGVLGRAVDVGGVLV